MDAIEIKVRTLWPDCSDSSVQEICAIIREYALTYRDLTDQESEEAGKMIDRILERDMESTSQFQHNLKGDRVSSERGDIIWSSLSDQEQRDYVAWLRDEIQRVKDGGAPASCWKGTPQEAVESLEAELKKRQNDIS